MSSVTLFQQYLTEKSKEKKEVLSLYNYLAGFCDKETPLKPSLIHHFFQKALLFPHWQSHSSFLRDQVIKDLKEFSKIYGPLSFDPEDLPLVDQWQCVQIKNEQERLNIVRQYGQNQKAKEEKLNVLPLENQQTLALILKPGGALKVLSFGPLFLIDQGLLKPLTPLSELNYSAQYELLPDVRQTIEIKSGHFIHFKVTGDTTKGTGTQGFCFQQAEEFNVKNIDQLAFLFLPLKKLESLFIEPSSDPHYQNLVRALNQSYQQLLSEPEKAGFSAHIALFQAKKALRNLYPKNSLLLLLTANVEFHLRKKQDLQKRGFEHPNSL